MKFVYKQGIILIFMIQTVGPVFQISQLELNPVIVIVFRDIILFV
jgi:hypothetical protein